MLTILINKNRKNTLNIVVLLLFIIGLLACGGGKVNNKKTTDEWPDTKWYQLENENLKLRIPTQLKRSSRYRIHEDLKIIANDSTRLRLVQNSLESLEFKDAEIDVLIDTTKDYRIIIICNIGLIEFDKTDATVLKQRLKSKYENDALNNPDMEFSEITAQIKQNSNHKLLRYSIEIQNKFSYDKVYHSLYYLNGDSYTLVVYEYSEDEESFEKHLWTSKRG